MLTAIRAYPLIPGLLVSALALSPAFAADAPVVPELAGLWKAKELKVPASSDLDRQVWGEDASKVRNVQLALEADGSATLRIEQSVVDSKGRPKQYSQSVVEAKLRVSEPAGDSDRVKPKVTVVSAQERYLDDPKDVRTIDGLDVSLDLMTRESPDLNIFYETPQGNGSFGETLQRQKKGSRG